MEEYYADRKRDYLQFFFGLKAKEWENTDDDRKLYCNIYHMLDKALLELIKLEPIQSTSIKVAMNDYLEKEQNDMISILKRFDPTHFLAKKQ